MDFSTPNYLASYILPVPPSMLTCRSKWLLIRTPAVHALKKWVHATCMQCSIFMQGQGPLQKADSYSRSANINQHDLYVAYGNASNLVPICMYAVSGALLLHCDNPVWSSRVGFGESRRSPRVKTQHFVQGQTPARPSMDGDAAWVTARLSPAWLLPPAIEPQRHALVLLRADHAESVKILP